MSKGRVQVVEKKIKKNVVWKFPHFLFLSTLNPSLIILGFFGVLSLNSLFGTLEPETDLSNTYISSCGGRCRYLYYTVECSNGEQNF